MSNSSPLSTVQTSENNPLRLDPLELPELPGKLGLTLSPGKKGHAQLAAHRHDRDLESDLERLRQVYGVGVLVSLLEPHERSQHGVEAMDEKGIALGIDVWRVPVPDLGVPMGRALETYRDALHQTLERLERGESVAVSCLGGRGRAGTFAACILIVLGENPAHAIVRVRAAREGAIETPVQEAFIRAFGGTQ